MWAPSHRLTVGRHRAYRSMAASKHFAFHLLHFNFPMTVHIDWYCIHITLNHITVSLTSPWDWPRGFRTSMAAHCLQNVLKVPPISVWFSPGIASRCPHVAWAETVRLLSEHQYQIAVEQQDVACCRGQIHPAASSTESGCPMIPVFHSGRQSNSAIFRLHSFPMRA